MNTIMIECPHCKQDFDKFFSDVSEYYAGMFYLTTTICPNCENEFSFAWSWQFSIDISVQKTEEHINSLKFILEWTKKRLADCEDYEKRQRFNEVEKIEAELEEAKELLLLNNNGG